MDLSNRTNTTKLSPRSSDNEFDGSDFSNNLFSYLAPLLTLFGEQVTKQFLSQAIGYADDILLAMAPLGILTCVVSAIRVRGRKWLKGLIGRAREDRATAEMEIMSSTSDCICELWNGAEIVREYGRPRTKEFIYQPVNRNTRSTDLLNSKIVYDLKTACEERILRISHLQYHALEPRDDLARAVECATRLMQQAPNLTLNATEPITSPGATWAFAALGVITQLGVIVIASLVTYQWHLAENGSSRVRYGFPIFVIGSSLQCAGIFLCAYILKADTEQINFELVEGKLDTKVVRVQCACTVSDQRFESYAIMNEEGNTTIRTFRTKYSRDFSVLLIIAACLSLGGYILQFVGLREIHWSVALAVLGATVVMVCVRAYVRRGLAVNPQVEKLYEGHELSWVALDALGLSSFELGSNTAFDETGTSEERSSQRSGTEADPETTVSASSLACKVVEVRKEISELAPWQDEHIALAHQLADAITGTLQYVMADLKRFEFDDEKLPVSLLAFEGRRGGKLSPKVFTLEEYSEEREKMEKSNGSRKKGQNIFRLNLRRHRRRERKGAERPTRTWFRARNTRSRYSTSARRDITSRRRPVTRQDAEADAEPVESGNWFWENRDLIEKAASDNDLKTPPGFSSYIFPETDEIFGACFTWESEAMLSGPSVGHRRTGAKYRFLARSIFQNDQDDEDADSENGLRRPRGNQGDTKKQVWATDVGSLAALLSLWMLTMETKFGPTFHHHASTRLLGCGWQVPVLADVPSSKTDPQKNKEILQWMEFIHSGSSGAGDDQGLGVEGMTDGYEDDHSGEESGDTGKKTDRPDFPEPDEDANLGESGADEDELLGVQQHSVQSKDLTSGYARPHGWVDFYSVWIERKTSAFPISNLPSYLRESQARHRNIFPPQRHTFGTCFSSRSMFGPTSLDQHAYGNMYFNHRKLRREAILHARNTQKGNKETSGTAARRPELLSIYVARR